MLWHPDQYENKGKLNTQNKLETCFYVFFLNNNKIKKIFENMIIITVKKHDFKLVQTLSKSRIKTGSGRGSKCS